MSITEEIAFNHTPDERQPSSLPLTPTLLFLFFKILSSNILICGSYIDILTMRNFLFQAVNKDNTIRKFKSLVGNVTET